MRCGLLIFPLQKEETKYEEVEKLAYGQIVGKGWSLD
jgi:hypothetical protein